MTTTTITRPHAKHRHNRSMSDIAAEIIQCCEYPTLRTHLVFRTKTSATELTGTLEILVMNGLLNYDGDTRLFSRTPKSARYLDLYERMRLIE